MATPIKIDVVTQADLKDLNGLSKTLDDVADNGESMGSKIEASLKDMESKVKPTNSEFRALAKSLDDLAAASGKSKTEALDDLKAAAEDAGQEINQGVLEALERIARQGESDVDQATKAMRELTDAARDADRAADIDIDVDRSGIDRAKEGVGELGDESRSIAQEAATSFDGSAESIGDVFRDLAATAFAGFGPAALIAGVTASAGIGIAIKALEEAADKANEAAEAGGDWAQAFNQAEGPERISALADSFQELQSEVVDTKEWYEVWQKEAVTAIEAVVDGYEAAGRSVEKYTAAFNQDDPQARVDALRAEEEALNEQADAYSKLNVKAADRFDIGEARRLGELRDQTRAAADEVGRQADVQEKANKITEAASKAEGGHAESLRETTEALEAKSEATRDSLGADLDWLDTLQGLSKAVEENGRSLNKNTSAGRENIRAVIDAADQISELGQTTLEQTGSQEKANAKMRQARRDFIDAADGAGLSRREVSRLVDQLVRVPSRTEARVSAPGARQAEGELRDVLKYAGAKKDMTVGVRASTGQADVDVANFRHRQQSIPITLGLRAV